MVPIEGPYVIFICDPNEPDVVSLTIFNICKLRFSIRLMVKIISISGVVDTNILDSYTNSNS